MYACLPFRFKESILLSTFVIVTSGHPSFRPFSFILDAILSHFSTAVSVDPLVETKNIYVQLHDVSLHIQVEDRTRHCERGSPTQGKTRSNSAHTHRAQHVPGAPTNPGRRNKTLRETLQQYEQFMRRTGGRRGGTCAHNR